VMASGVYRASGAGEIADAFRDSKLALTTIRVSSKDTLLQDIAKALDFPDWFGGNWDALEDCLSDLSWREAAGHVLVFEGFQSLPEDDLGVLIDVLRSAAEFWAGQGRPFFAVFIDPASMLKLDNLS
jgi:RNAse (barnase) inhibitor barstar